MVVSDYGGMNELFSLHEKCTLNEDDDDDCICIFSLASSGLLSLSWQSAWLSWTKTLEPQW